MGFGRWAGGGVALVAMAVPVQAQAWTTFYSAYQDGLAALSQGKPALAERAFRSAIAMRPEPGTQVHTYGMNFLGAYHPHLKLAEAALAAGDLAQAQAALRESAARGVEPQAQRDALQARLALAHPPVPPPQETAAPRVQDAPVRDTPKAPQQAQLATAGKASEAPAAQPRPSTPSPAVTPQPTRGGPAALPQPARSGSGKAGPPKEGTPGPDTPPAPAGTRPEVTPLAAPAPLPSATPIAVPAPTPRPGPGPAAYGGLAGLAVLAGGAWLAFRRSRRRPSAPGPATTAFPMATAGPTQPAAPEGTERRDPNLERAFGPWVAKRVLGTGGCGTAYYGVHADTGAEVAIKVPHPHLLQNPEFLGRFRREAAMGAVLAHPGIVGILDPGPADGDPWLVMPFINGVTLEAYLQQFSPLPIPAAIRLASDVAEAIGYAHTKGVVHRDLKPANIMVCPQGAVVMDLGIARILDSGKHTSVYMGTPTYSAPEAMQNPSVGPPADRYALGIILFEMLAGAPPFRGDNAFKVLEAHTFEPLPDLLAQRPLVPARLNRLIQRLCDKKPEERPEDGETIQILKELKEEFPCATA